MGQRTKGRKFLLQSRYAAENRDDSTIDNMELLDFSNRITDSETRVWLKDLSRMIDDNREDIDNKIEVSLVNWSMARLTPITKLILEQAIAEATYFGIPIPVVIKEGVKLAIEFEGPKTGSFVNGVLDKILREDAI